jgi:hypothetical protein
MFRSSRHHYHHHGTKPTRYPTEADKPLVLWFGSVVMIHHISKHVGMFIVMMQYKYVRNTILLAECFELVIDNAWSDNTKLTVVNTLLRTLM